MALIRIVLGVCVGSVIGMGIYAARSKATRPWTPPSTSTVDKAGL